MLWYTEGTWYVGDADKCGGRSGFMSAEDAAFLPERIDSQWEVAGDGWHAAPDLKCVTAEEFASVAGTSHDHPSIRRDRMYGRALASSYIRHKLLL